MTNPFNAAFDAIERQACLAAGIADAAFYTSATGGAELPATIEIARGVNVDNLTTGQVENDRTVIVCFAADIGAAPARGARFRIGLAVPAQSDEIFSVDRLQTKDESRYVCIVKTGV